MKHIIFKQKVGKSEIVFFGATTNRKRLNMNKFHEPHYIWQQGQPEGIYLIQDMKPKHKAGKRRKCFSTATTATKICIALSNQEKK